MKGDTGTVLLISAGILAAAGIVKYGGEVKAALGKLTVKLDSIQLIPMSQTKPAVKGMGNVFADVGNFFSEVFKKGKSVLQSLGAKQQHVGLAINLKVSNPTSTAIVAKDFSFTGKVSHAGREVANINVAQPITIPANGSANVKIPIALSINNVVSNLLDSLKGKNLSSIATVGIKGSGYAMATAFPIDQTVNLLEKATGGAVSGIGAVRRMPFFKHVKTLDCLYCGQKFPLTDKNFRHMNKHGWGACEKCWNLDMPNSKVYFSPDQVKQLHKSIAA
jgi:hypothetical protein